MKKAVQFGAGNIGRGFIGQLFSRSGYELAFVDVDQRIVSAMNERRRYPVRVVAEKGGSESYVEGVRAVNGLEMQACAREIAQARVVGTAVGANVLPRIAPTLAAGLSLRWEGGNEEPLNVILCENLVDADLAFREMLAANLDRSEDKRRLTRLVGLVRASVGRMVPVMTDEMREGDPLRIWVEEYDHLPVDAESFVGRPPRVRNMEGVRPFELYIQRKLYIHNMGHAAASYLGALRGYTYVWEAVGDPEVASVALRAMFQSAAAIAADQGVPVAPLLAHAEELLGRFANRQLGDTIERVGRDLPRKLAPKDRLMGAIALCAKHSLPREAICQAAAAALLFEDSTSALRQTIATSGPRATLESLCALKRGDPDLELILDKYAELSSRPGLAIK